jgi:hypothetical protein
MTCKISGCQGEIVFARHCKKHIIERRERANNLLRTIVTLTGKPGKTEKLKRSIETLSQYIAEDRRSVKKALLIEKKTTALCK